MQTQNEHLVRGDTSLLVAGQDESYASARQLIERSGIMQEKSRLDAALAETGKEIAVLKKEMDKLKKKDNRLYLKDGDKQPKKKKGLHLSM